jgi:hypothetical protein
MLLAHQAVVWFTGPAYPYPLGPYESRLTTFLDNGGRLFLSGEDILDGSAGTTSFVKNYLHVQWSDTFNDQATYTVTGVLSNPVTSGTGPTPLVFNIAGLVDYTDAFTPTVPASPAFTGIYYGNPVYNGMVDALTVSNGKYKVMFLAFPFEVLGTATDRATLMTAALDWLSKIYPIYLPLVLRN